jgi:phage-related protein
MTHLFYFHTGNNRSPVEEFINKEDKRSRSKIYQVIGHLEQHGLKLPEKFLKRISSSKHLWELRIKTHTQYRIFLASIDENGIVLLHAFTKKTQKTPAKEIKVAEDRLKQLQITKY